MSDPPRASKVPSGRLNRFLQIGVTASRMAAAGMAEKARRAVERAGEHPSSLLLTAGNAKLFADRLSRLRGAAMKLGQMLSLEGNHLLPAEFTRALERLRASGDRMPESQVRQVLVDQYGDDWEELFQSLEFEPMASASIGQVHRAVAKDGRVVALKIQYPGVAKSIDSDVDNLATLLSWTRLLPGPLDISGLAAELKRQLAEEVDYDREKAQSLAYDERLGRCGRSGYRVVGVHADLCRPQVLATELLELPALMDWAKTASQEQRDDVAHRLLSLLLLEFFEMGLMQTDPNPSNYLYDPASDEVVLIDFGATREVPEGVAQAYRTLLSAVALGDRRQVALGLDTLGVLPNGRDTPPEVTELMIELTLMLHEVLGVDAAYDFGTSTLAERMFQGGRPLVRYHKHVRPPPPQFLFFQRKLDGMFLVSSSLGARVNCRRLVEKMGLLGGGS